MSCWRPRASKHNFSPRFYEFFKVPWPKQKEWITRFCRSMNFYHHEVTKVSKDISIVWSFFGHTFGALQDTPYTQSATKWFVSHFENPHFAGQSAFGHLQEPEMYPQHKIFSPRSSYSIRSSPEKLWHHATPRGPHLKSKNRNFWPNDQTSTPKSRDMGRRSTEIILPQKQLISL